MRIWNWNETHCTEGQIEGWILRRVAPPIDSLTLVLGSVPGYRRNKGLKQHKAAQNIHKRRCLLIHFPAISIPQELAEWIVTLIFDRWRFWVIDDIVLTGWLRRNERRNYSAGSTVGLTTYFYALHYSSYRRGSLSSVPVRGYRVSTDQMTLCVPATNNSGELEETLLHYGASR